MTNTLKPDTHNQRSTVFIKTVPTAIYLDTVLILICVLSVFGRTLTSYFLADDFGEIHYLHRICSGDFNLLIANFTGNYMQIPGMSVYRPFLLLSLLIDFIFWKANAFGFYATNLLFYFLDSLLLYLVVFKLGLSAKPEMNRWTALTAAALFALSPLHCESVSWVLGRVDIVCAFFYLLSFILILKSIEKGSKKITAFAVAAFIAALLVKEMAIGIPVIAFLAGALYGTEKCEKNGRRENSLWRGLVFAWPYLAATVFYFTLRFLCLGTLIGGYVAGFGASQEKNALTRWLDKDTLERIAFPLVQGHFQCAEPLSSALFFLYCVLAAIFAIRLLAGQLPLKFFLFLSGWLLTALLPIYKLWGIGYSLEGARFLFFFTMPMATLMAAALFQNRDGIESKKMDRALLLVSSAVALALSALSGFIAAKTNLIWVNAGKEVKAVAQSARAILSANQTSAAILLGLPKESKGTHMILNGATFKALISPPFAEKPPRRKFAVFEPIMYSPDYEIDPDRFRSLLKQGSQVFVWSSERRSFDKVEYNGQKITRTGKFALLTGESNLQIGGPSGLFSGLPEGIHLENGAGDSGIQMSNLNLNPTEADFAVLDLQLKKSDRTAEVGASWAGKSEEPAKDNMIRRFVPGNQDGQFEKCYLPLSRHWQWFQSPTIDKIFLSLPSGNCAVRSIEIAPQKECCPLIAVEPPIFDENGIYTMQNGQEVRLKIDSTAIAGAEKLSLEIGKANFFFDNFKQNDGAEAVEKQIRIPKLQAEHLFKSGDFSGSGYFQVRVKAFDKNDAPIGSPSRCITFAFR